MLTKKICNRKFTVLAGRITNDSYSTTIKKLALLNAKPDSQNLAKSATVQGKAFGQPTENVFVQIVPARLCAGRNHVFFALEHAFSAIDSGTAFSHRPELEFLIHFFGEKQLQRVLEKARFGGNEKLVMVVGGAKEKDIKNLMKNLGFVSEKNAQRDWKVSDNSELMQHFDISKGELLVVSDMKTALEELVIGKISMVALEK